MVSRIRIRSVVGRFLIIVNLVLASIFVYKVVTLHRELGRKEMAGRDLSIYDFAEIKRPVIETKGNYGAMFGVTVPETSATGMDGHAGSVSGILNQLTTGDLIIRVKGIFLAEDEQFAVISITGKKQKKKQEVVKVSVGEELKGFHVTLIEQNTVHLSGPSSQTAVLRIFRKGVP